MDELILIRLVALLVLLTLSAFFAGCDIALFSLSQSTVDRLKKSHGRIGARIEALLSRPQKLLVTIYIGNELINVAISAIATFIALDLFGSVGVAISLGMGTLALLIFGEITPKSFAHNNKEKWAIFAAYPLSVFMWLVFPIEIAVTWIASRAAQLFGGDMDHANPMLDEDELKSLMENSAEEGVIDEDEKEMIQNVFELGDVAVGEVMTPRTEILAVEVNTPLAEAWDKMAQSYFARAPVYDESIDNIVGVLFKKDLLKLDYPPPGEITLSDLAREPFIVPQTIMIKELLQEFRKRKVHLAIVMDENFGVQGVATLDDVIDELLGERRPAHERHIDEFARVGAGAYRVKSSKKLEEFNEFFDSNIEREDIETLGGYVFHLFGRAPKWGESVTSDGFQFTVERIKGHRITELRVKKINGGAHMPEAEQ